MYFFTALVSYRTINVPSQWLSDCVRIVFVPANNISRSHCTRAVQSDKKSHFYTVHVSWYVLANLLQVKPSSYSLGPRNFVTICWNLSSDVGSGKRQANLVLLKVRIHGTVDSLGIDFLGAMHSGEQKFAFNSFNSKLSQRIFFNECSTAGIIKQSINTYPVVWIVLVVQPYWDDTHSDRNITSFGHIADCGTCIDNLVFLSRFWFLMLGVPSFCVHLFWLPVVIMKWRWVFLVTGLAGSSTSAKLGNVFRTLMKSLLSPRGFFWNSAHSSRWCAFEHKVQLMGGEFPPVALFSIDLLRNSFAFLS